MYTALPLIRRSLHVTIISLALLGGCASKNPLFDDYTAPPTKTKPIAASTEKNQPEQKMEPKQPVEAESVSNYLNKPPPGGFNRIVNIFTPYRIDIQQGNFISHEMLAKIQPEMTREQVKFVLGTPLLTDIFHANRWDYLFRLQKPDGTLATSRVTIFFDDNRVREIKSDKLPSESEYLSNISGGRSRPSEKSKAPSPAPVLAPVPENQEPASGNKEPVLNDSDTVKTNTPSKEETP